MLILALIQQIRDIPPGWAEVGAASIEVGVPVLLGVVSALMGWVLHRLKKVQTHAAAAADGVTNSHDKNLRDDLDGKQDETRSLLTEALDKLGQIQAVQVAQGAVQRDQAKDIGGIRAEMRTLHENDTKHVRQANRTAARVDKLERTIPPHKRKRPPATGA